MNRLAQLVDRHIADTGTDYRDIARTLGIPTQSLLQIMMKVNFNIDDANMILRTIGYQMDYVIKPL